MLLRAAGSAARQRLLTPLVIPVAVYLAIACLLFSPFLAHPANGVPGGPDGIIYVWYFEWVEQALIHGHNPFISGALNAPTGVNAMWNTSMLAVAVVCVPLTALIGPFVTVVVVAVVGPVASASVAYYVIRRLSGSTGGGILAGLLFGFGPYFVGQNGHIHLTFAVFTPLLLLFGYQLIIEQRKSPVRLGGWLGLTVGLSLLATQEVVALSALIAVVAVIALAIIAPDQVRPRRAYAVKGLGVAAGVAVVIDAVPLYYQFFGPLAIRGVPESPHLQRLDLAGLVRPSRLQFFASSADITANRGYPANNVENTGYLGWPLLIVCVGILVWFILRRDRFAYWWIITAAVTLIISLGTPMTVDGHSLGIGPWRVLGRLPLLEGAIPVRLSLITTLLVGLLLAMALARLSGRARLIGLVVAALALVPLIPFGRYRDSQTSAAPRFFTTSAVDVVHPGTNVLIVPVKNSPYGQVTPMTWQIRAHLRFNLVGGYDVINLKGRMSYLPDESALARTLDNAATSPTPPGATEVAAARRSIARFRIRYVIVADQQQQADRIAATAADITGCIPRHVIDVTLCEIPGSA